MDEISSSATSAAKSIIELKTYVASTNKADDTAIIKLVSLQNKLQSSEDARVKGGCTPEEEPVFDVKEKDGGTECVPGENSVENTIEGTEGGRSIGMGGLKWEHQMEY